MTRRLKYPATKYSCIYTFFSENSDVPVLFILALSFAKQIIQLRIHSPQNRHAHVAFKAKLIVGNTFVQLQGELCLSSLTVSLVTNTTVNTRSLLVDSRRRHLPHKHHKCQRINIFARYKYYVQITHHALSFFTNSTAKFTSFNVSYLFKDNHHRAVVMVSGSRLYVGCTYLPLSSLTFSCNEGQAFVNLRHVFLNRDIRLSQRSLSNQLPADFIGNTTYTGVRFYHVECLIIHIYIYICRHTFYSKIFCINLHIIWNACLTKYL